MPILNSDHRDGFRPGLTRIAATDDRDTPTGIGFEVLKLRSGETHQETTPGETAWLLMSGTVEIAVGNQSAKFSRASLFEMWRPVRPITGGWCGGRCALT